MKKWAIVAIAAILLAFLLFRLKEPDFPSLLGKEDVPEEGIPADVDFPVAVEVKGGMLEVAYVTGRKVFPKSQDPEILGKSVSYCREKASWIAPYKITYRLRLGERWPIRYRNGTLIARVPELEPSLPVAIDSKGLTEGAGESCWFFPDLGTRQKALKSISPALARIANSSKTKDFAREKARKTVTQFLRTWAFNQDQYSEISPDTKIVVIFPGE
ncbi:hypothetical protein [Erythrobacter tepidarius]|uniref:hypothetical protein n=1 Tax=Erythrobacter tepidarius TaxID=60454 RepID=UPI00117D2DDA|nr:hypothetical protein [Erythrobacter tepidarius]